MSESERPVPSSSPISVGRIFQKKAMSGVWLPDKGVLECFLCTSKFSTIIRKHHCRRCGLIMCNKCSLSRLSLGDGIPRCRVCDKCVGDLEFERQRGLLGEKLREEERKERLEKQNKVMADRIVHLTDNLDEKEEELDELKKVVESTTKER